MKLTDFTEVVSRLVAIPSTNINPHALQQAIDFVVDFVSERAQVTVERFLQNGKPSALLYIGESRPTMFDLLLNVHVDVVPAPPEAFIAQQEGDFLYGRGTGDMKATAIALADLFRSHVATVPYSLGLQIVSDEETSGVDGALFQVNEGVRAVMAVMGEYNLHANTIYNAARGAKGVDIAFTGTAAHAAYPWKGDNAVVRAMNFIRRLEEYYPTPTKEEWVSTIVPSAVTTVNDAVNKVPDYATVTLDCRYISGDVNFATNEAFERFIASIDPRARIVAQHFEGAPVYVPTSHPYITRLAASLEHVTGKKALFRARFGGSDARHFAQANVPCIEFGMISKNVHSDGECVDLRSYEPYMQTMEKFLYTL